MIVSLFFVNLRSGFSFPHVSSMVLFGANGMQVGDRVSTAMKLPLESLFRSTSSAAP